MCPCCGVGWGSALGSGSLTREALREEMSPGYGHWLCAAPAFLWPKNVGRKGMVGNVRCSECPEKTPVRWKVVLSRDIMALKWPRIYATHEPCPLLQPLSFPLTSKRGDKCT